MKKYLVSLMISCMALWSLVSCEQAQEKPVSNHKKNEALVAKIDSIAQNFMDKGTIMGMSIAVMQQGDTVYNQGFGFVDSTKTKPVTTGTIFDMASVSKLLGSVMTMKLVEEGKLSLENTLLELLPDFPNREQAKTVKLKHLLSHTSGIQDYANVIDSVYDETKINPTKVDFYQFFKTHSLDFQPGEKWQYSNSGFLLMAMIVERITGNSYEDELDRIINQTTGSNIKLVAKNINHPQTTAFFTLEDSTITPVDTWPWFKGDGGMTTTAIELAQFPSKWYNGTIISNESFERMTAPFTLTNGLISGYGLGVRTGDFEGQPVVGHTGGGKSSLAIMKYYPGRDLSVVVFVNTDNVPQDALYIEGYIALAVLGLDVPELSLKEITEEDFTQFIGDYEYYRYLRTPGSITMVIHENEPHLYRKYTGSESKGEKLYYLGNSEFAPERNPMDRIIFDTNADGEVVVFREYWNGLFFRMGRSLVEI